MASRKKNKIAFIHPDMGIGGAERLVLDVAGALVKQNNEVIFITNHFDPNHAFEELKNNEYKVRVIGDWIPRSVFGKCQALCAYLRMLYLSLVYIIFIRKEDEPDLYFVDLIPIAVLFLKLAKLRVIYYCHHPDLLASPPGGTLKNLYRRPLDWLECKATNESDVILVNSEYTASIFRKTFPEILKPIKILYPTIALSYQQAVSQLRYPKGIHSLVSEVPKGDNFVFLSVNRFHPAKKLELAIDAMCELKNRVSEEEWKRIYLIVAGGYDPNSVINAVYYEDLNRRVKEKKLDSNVIFLKSPSDNLKTELLASCTCLIYTPVKEHFGIVPLEAMMVSKPVIACNSGGPRETVDHGTTGYLCEPNSQSIADFMFRMITQSNLKEMGIQGKKRLEERFSYNSFSKSLQKVITTTLNSKNVKDE